jgi:hypothetical protein
MIFGRSHGFAVDSGHNGRGSSAWGLDRRSTP